MKFSIIVAVFNKAATLQQCITSINQQSYPDKELIIVDGGSRDGTADLLKANNEQIDYWISEPDSGIYNAWNKALEQAKGEWICFLGADDYLWDEHVLERVAEQLELIPHDILVAYGQIMLLNTNGESLYPIADPWEKIKFRFRQIMCIPHQGVMHRRSLFERHGKFDESFRIAGDYELLLRELKTANAAYIPGIVITGMRRGGISSNPLNAIEAMKETRRAQQIHGQYLPKGIWLMAMARVYIRIIMWKVLGEHLTRIFLDLSRRIRGLPLYWTQT